MSAASGQPRYARPDLVVHRHAHRGAAIGAIGPVPVHNVAVHVTAQDFALLEI